MVSLRSSSCWSGQLVVAEFRVVGEPEAPRPHVPSELHVGQSIADHVAARDVVGRVVHILFHQPGIRLTGRGVVLGVGPVDEFFPKLDALGRQRASHGLVGRPEGVLGKFFGTQPVLVGDHDQLVVQLPHDAAQPAEDAGVEVEFLYGIHLVVFGFEDEGAVAV